MKKLLLIFCSLAIAIAVEAQIIHIPADQPSIQAGIDAAKHGDTVLVADGVYHERIDFKGKAITLSSNFIIDGDETHIDSTIIDGGKSTNADSVYVIYFVNGEDSSSILSGFTLRYWTYKNIWSGQEMGGVIYFEIAFPKIHDIRIVNQSLQVEIEKNRKTFIAWIFQTDFSVRQKGTLNQMNDSSLAIMHSGLNSQGLYSDREISIINVHQIEKIKIRRKGNIGKGILIGALSGLAIGVIIGLAEGDDVDDGSWDIFNNTAGEKAMMYGATFLIPGAAIGAIIGSIKIKIPINGSIDNYKKNRKRLEKYTTYQN